jgi:hypothetical protein
MSARRETLNVESCKSGLDQIEKRRKLGKLSEAEADAARHALLARLQSQRWDFGVDARRAARSLLAPAAAFLLVVGIGTAAYFRTLPQGMRLRCPNRVTMRTMRCWRSFPTTRDPLTANPRRLHRRTASCCPTSTR